VWQGSILGLLVISSQRIDAGLWNGKTWVDGAFQTLPLENAGDLAALDRGLSDLGQRLAGTAWQGGKQTLRLRVLLADAWFASTTVPWNPRAAQGGRLLSHVRQCFSGLGVELQHDDCLRTVDAPYRQPRWAVAYPAPVMQRLSAFAAALGARFESTAPLGLALIHAFAKHGNASSVFALIDGSEISLWTSFEGCPALLSSTIGVSAPTHHVDSTLDLLWRRVRLRDPRLGVVEQVQVFDLTGAPVPDLPAEGFSPLRFADADTSTPVSLQLAAMAANFVFDVDAIQRSRRTSLRVLLALALLIGFVATVFFFAGRAMTEEANAKRELATRLTAAAPKPPPVWSKEERQKIQAVNVAVRQLNLPVAPLLRAIQPPKDIRVAILGVEFSPARGEGEMPTIKIAAEARTGEEMARYTSFLATRRPLIDAYLINHEVAENVPLKPYRFTVEAKWRD